MKKNTLMELKKSDIQTLQIKAKELGTKAQNLLLEQSLNKLTDKKALSKARHDLAQTLTILRQKQLLAQLEGAINGQ